MSASARRRRLERKRNPFLKANLAPLRRPEGCMERCPECLTRCLGCPCCLAACPTHEGDPHDHLFACDC